MAQADPERWRCIDGTQAPYRIEEHIWSAVAARIGL
jgi:hypothetical protein